jgi:predicted O-methyltransferase YrrM
MNGITAYLKSKDMSLIDIPEVTNENYRMFNDGGVECEVGEFLYGFTRVMKPQNVFETGTHLGISSSYIGQALKENGSGLLTTVEINKEHINVSKERYERIGIDKQVIVDKEPSLEYDLEYECELMLLDSEPEYRFKELIRFYPKLAVGGYVFIHDLHRHMSQEPNFEHGFGWPYGPLPLTIKNMVLDDMLRPFHFSTPRGLTGFYKPSEKDFNWRKL